MSRKYELVAETKVVRGAVLHRIRRFRDGLLGGFVESEENLSHDGNCFLYEDSTAQGESKIFGDASVYGEVYGRARIYESASIRGSVFDDAQISGAARLSGRSYGHAIIRGKAVVK